MEGGGTMNVIPIRRQMDEAQTTRPEPEPDAVPPKGRWVCWRPEAALDGTEFLSIIQEVAYRRTLDWIFKTDDNLPDNDQAMARLTKTGRQWKAVKESLIALGKIYVRNGMIRSAKASATCDERRSYVAQRSGAGTASSEARKALKANNTASTAVGAPVATPVRTELPLTLKVQEKEGKEEKDSPPSRKREGGKPKPSEDLSFEMFWADYPRGPGGRRRGSRKRCEALWNAAIKSGVDPQKILDLLEDDKQHEYASCDPRFIHYPETWLGMAKWRNGSALDNDTPAESKPAPDLFGV